MPFKKFLLILIAIFFIVIGGAVGLTILFSVPADTVFENGTISSPYAEMLQSDEFHLQYMTDSMWSDSEYTVVDEFYYDGQYYFQYDYDGMFVQSITNEDSISVATDGEVLQTTSNTQGFVSPYYNLVYTDSTGYVSCDGTIYYYEEYQYSRDDGLYRLRFLFDDDNNLWGLQYDYDSQYAQVLSLTNSVPESLTSGL